jgi:hypothetical protein
MDICKLSFSVNIYVKEYISYFKPTIPRIILSVRTYNDPWYVRQGIHNANYVSPQITTVVLTSKRRGSMDTWHM